jgi:hypothetical protein
MAQGKRRDSTTEAKPDLHGRPEPFLVPLPHALAKRVQAMAAERNMFVPALVAELVQLGMISLQYPELEWAVPLRGVDAADGDFVVGQR